MVIYNWLLVKKQTSFILGFVIIFCGCSTPFRKGNAEPVLATINGIPVYEHEIDSLAVEELYSVKKEALKFIIEKKLLSNEAKRRGVSMDSLIRDEIINQTKPVTPKEYQQYAAEHLSFQQQADSLSIVKQIMLSKQQERREKYLAGLKKNYDIKTSLHPEFFSIVNPERLYYYNLNEPSGNKFCVYVIADYECTSCQAIQSALTEIIQKYDGRINFRYVSYSQYVDKSILAADAANEQGKFVEMHHLIFNNRNLPAGDSIYFLYARKLNLNIGKFRKDFENTDNIKKHLKNVKTLEELGIYSTPVFIVNDKVVKEDNSISFLDTLLEEELKQSE